MYREQMPKLALFLWSKHTNIPVGLDDFRDYIQKIVSEKGVFLIKFDGNRQDFSGDIYTVLMSGETLGDEYIRADGDNLEEALSDVIINYAVRQWAFIVSH